MINNLDKLTKPDEFVNHYYEELKNYLNSNNIYLSKTGLIGFFLQLFGNFQFDIKTYYDNLFKESFVSLSSNTKNIYLHSLLNGFNPSLAHPSLLNGNFYLNFNNISEFNSLTYSYREIYLKNIQIKINDIIYVSDVEYVVNIEKVNNKLNYSVDILTPKEKERISFSKNSPYIPLINFYQYEETERQITTPPYSFGTYYEYELDLDDNFLYDLEVLVNGEKYDIKYLKNFDGSNNVIFLKVSNKNSYILTFGDGIKGRHVPDSNVLLKIKKTKGNSGNILNKEDESISGKMTIFDYKKNSQNPTKRTVNISNFLTTKIESGSGGQDILFGDELKNELLKYIQSRENLITRYDYENYIKNNNNKIFFKKYDLYNNTIYVYNYYNNQIDVPTKTITRNILSSLLDNQQDQNGLILYPEFNIKDDTFISPFLYKYNNEFETYGTYLFNNNLKYYATNYSFLFKQIYEEYDDANNFLKDVVNLDYDEQEENFTEKLSVDNFYLPPSIYLELEYINNNSITKIKVVSFNNIADSYDVFISSPELNIKNEKMTTTQDNKLIFYYDYDSIINHKITVNLDVKLKILDFDDNYLRNLSFYSFDFENIIQFENNDEKLFIKKSNEPGSLDTYYVDIPLIKKNDFLSNPSYFTNLLYKTFLDINYNYNRMVTDEAQIRFLNSYYIDKDFLNAITFQNYSFDLFFPLKVNINLIISSREINILEEVNKLKIKIGEFLLENKTGSQLSIYKSEIVEISHSFNWIKSCEVTLKDNDNNEFNGLETIDDNDYFKNMNKKTSFHFNPVFFWWDINNIEINYEIREN